MLFFRPLLALVRVSHVFFTIGTQAAGVAGFVVARLFAVRPFVVRAGLIGGVVISHTVGQLVE